MSGLIAADADAAFDSLARRLIDRATTLAAARAETRQLTERRDETRWRRADLVWPLFGKG